MKTLSKFLKNALIICAILWAQAVYSQHWEWAKAAYDFYYESEDVTTDVAGNIYIVHMDFWNESIAVTKMNPQGTVLWNKQIGCCAMFSYGMRIAVDQDSRVYILGEYESTVQFGNITLQTGTPSSDERYTFLVKLNAQGNLVWAKNAAGPTKGYLTNLQERDVVVDPQGKIIITGTVNYGTAYFDNIVSPSNTSHPNAFVAKYNPNGTLAWVNRAGGGASYAASLDIDNQGRIYAIGYYSGAGGGAQWGSVSLPVPAGVVSYHTKLSTSGNVVWSKKINAKVSGIAANGAGDSFITGSFTGTADMGNGISLTSAGGADMMVARYNGSGNVLWARSGGGAAPDYGYDLDIDQEGNCYVVGQYQSATAVFNAKVLGLTSGVEGAGFTARYLSNGTIKWVEPIIPNDYTKAERISTTTNGKCHILTQNEYSGGNLKFGKDITLTNGGNDAIAKLDGQAIRIPILVFDEAFICFPCFPFDPVLDFEYRFWSERVRVNEAIRRRVSDRENRDDIFWKGNRLEIRLHDKLEKGTYYFQLRAMLRDGTRTAWTKAIAFEVGGGLRATLVYPNPVKEQLKIDYQATEKETILLTVYDRYGSVLLQENREALEGQNTLELNLPAVVVDANPLTLQLQSKLQGIRAWQLIKE